MKNYYTCRIVCRCQNTDCYANVELLMLMPNWRKPIEMNWVDPPLDLKQSQAMLPWDLNEIKQSFLELRRSSLATSNELRRSSIRISNKLKRPSLGSLQNLTSIIENQKLKGKKSWSPPITLKEVDLPLDLINQSGINSNRTHQHVWHTQKLGDKPLVTKIGFNTLIYA